MNVLVRELMTPEVVTVDYQECLANAAVCMSYSHVGSLVVLAGGALAGMITERDLMRAVAARRDLNLTQVCQYMAQPLRTVAAASDVEDAKREMVKHGVRHLPVTDHGRLVGFLSARDLLAPALRAVASGIAGR
ncbi:MAG: CBS domain-containing protein [Chloroflexota bacterium]